MIDATGSLEGVVYVPLVTLGFKHAWRNGFKHAWRNGFTLGAHFMRTIEKDVKDSNAWISARNRPMASTSWRSVSISDTVSAEVEDLFVWGLGITIGYSW